MIQLLIYAGIAIAILGAVYGVDKSRQAIGERRVLAQWAPTIEECKALGNAKPVDCANAIRAAVNGRDTCLAANKSLDEQFETFRAMHNAEVKAANEAYERAKGARAKSTADAAPKLADLAMAKFDAAVAAKGGGFSCEQMDAALLKEAERKTRYYGTATESAPIPDGPRIVEPASKPAERPQPTNPLKAKP